MENLSNLLLIFIDFIFYETGTHVIDLTFIRGFLYSVAYLTPKETIQNNKTTFYHNLHY